MGVLHRLGLNVCILRLLFELRLLNLFSFLFFSQAFPWDIDTDGPRYDIVGGHCIVSIIL